MVLSKIKLLKKRRALVISAGGIRSGIQVLYLGFENDGWELYSKALMPYPQKVGELIVRLSDTQEPAALSEIGWLDYKMTALFLESANGALSAAPTSVREPHYAVLNKPTLWKGGTGESLQQHSWNLTVGDELYLANALDVPVMTEFLRHNILAGGPGILPSFPGSVKVAKDLTGVNVFVNIGLVSRVTVIDKRANRQILESDAGPGTVLIDTCARAAGCADGFDRDGQMTSRGQAVAACIEELAADPWIAKAAPKQASPETFSRVLKSRCLKPLSRVDRLATITALTAKSIYDFYRREYREPAPPEALWVSGGGVNNLALMDFLKASFDPIPVKSVEELNIPADMKIPLTLGLTVDAFIMGEEIPWESGPNPKVNPLCRCTMPV